MEQIYNPGYWQKVISVSSLHSRLWTYFAKAKLSCDATCLTANLLLQMTPYFLLSETASQVLLDWSALKPAHMEIALLIRVLSMWLKTSVKAPITNLQKKKDSDNACFTLLASSESPFLCSPLWSFILPVWLDDLISNSDLASSLNLMKTVLAKHVWKGGSDCTFQFQA